MTFDNNNSLKPTRKEEGITQSGLIEKKVKDIEDQIDDIKERLTPLENTVEGFENEVNTDSVVAGQVHSGHDYTDELSVSGDADVQGTISAAKVTAADVEVSNKVKTKDAQVTNDLTVEGTGTFAQLSAENFDIETFNADELNATELSSDNADITNLASDSITADEANITSINSNVVTSGNVEASEKVIAQDAELSGTLDAAIIYSKNLRVSRKLNALELITETMQSGRLFIAPEQMFLIPENGWIHFHNVNAGRFILYLTDFTDTTTNIHSLGNVKFSAVIDYVNNSEKGAVKVLYVQPELKSFEAVYVADNGEIWFKRSSQYLNARRAVVFAESEKELIVDTFAENAQTFDVSTAKEITLERYDASAEINTKKYLKGDYTIDGNVYITGYLTPGETITERSLFLGYSDLVTADNNGVLSAYGATITDDVTIGGELAVTGDVTTGADLSVTGETTLGDDLTVTGDVTVTGDTAITGDETVNGILTVNGDIIQNGAAYETHAEKIYTKKDMIITRDGAISALPNGELSGITAKHYDSDGNDGVLGFDNTGTARVGDKGSHTVIVYSSDGITFYEDAEMTISATIPSGVTPTATGETNQYSYEIDYDTTQPLLTRDEVANLSNGDVLTWDSTDKKAIGSNAFQTKILETPITIGGTTETTVEDVLIAFNGNIIPYYYYDANTNRNDDNVRKTTIEYVALNLIGIATINSYNEIHFKIRYSEDYYHLYLLRKDSSNSVELLEMSNDFDTKWSWRCLVTDSTFTANLQYTNQISIGGPLLSDITYSKYGFKSSESVSYILIADITKWYNSTSSSDQEESYFDVIMFVQRYGGMPRSGIVALNLTVSYFRNGLSFPNERAAIGSNNLSNTGGALFGESFKAAIVKYQNKYYTAIKVDTPYGFQMMVTGIIRSKVPLLTAISLNEASNVTLIYEN